MGTHIFKCKIYDKLVNGITKSAVKTALLIKGARRVGKSTIAEEFAGNYYESNRYLLYTKDIRKEQDIIWLPVYMVGLL